MADHPREKRPGTAENAGRRLRADSRWSFWVIPWLNKIFLDPFFICSRSTSDKIVTRPVITGTVYSTLHSRADLRVGVVRVGRERVSVVTKSGVAGLGLRQRVRQVAFGTGHGRKDSSIGPPGQQPAEHRAKQHVHKVMAVVLCAGHRHIESIQCGQHGNHRPPCSDFHSGSLQLTQEPERRVAQCGEAHTGVARRGSAEAVQELLFVSGGADLFCVVESVLERCRIWLASVEKIRPTPANPVLRHVCHKDAGSKGNKVS
ncbi:hypothetical protein KL908_003807 [Ogataea polymorpha]|nr:hypothetical protein KL908_003807 [Ogataea polymorpha]